MYDHATLRVATEHELGVGAAADDGLDLVGPIVVSIILLANILCWKRLMDDVPLTGQFLAAPIPTKSPGRLQDTELL